MASVRERSSHATRWRVVRALICPCGRLWISNQEDIDKHTCLYGRDLLCRVEHGTSIDRDN
jgi:hypothetical protein